MKRLFVAVLVVLIVLIAALLVLPSLIDWSRYKGEIAARIGAATGRAVTIDGRIEFALLPTPTLSLGGAHLVNPPGFDAGDTIRLEQLDARIALLPLFSGRIQVESVTLVEPDILLAVTKDGRDNWHLRPLHPGLVSALEFDRVRIVDGRLTYRDAATGIDERLEAINGQLSAASPDGPFEIQGRAKARGVPLRIEASVGRAAASGTMPVRALAALDDGSATMRFAGILTGGAERRLQGDLRAEGSDLRVPFATLMAASGTPVAGALPLVLAQPFTIRGPVVQTVEAVGLKDIDVEIGAAHGTGSMLYTPGAPGRVDVAFAFGHMDLDGLVAAGQSASRVSPPAAPVNPSANPPANPSPAGAAGGGLHASSGPAVTLDVSIDAVAVAGNAVRQVRFQGKLAGGTLAVGNLSALLPGETATKLVGTVTVDDGKPVIDASVEAAADNARALFDWLKIDIGAVPADRLRKAALTAQVRGQPDSFQLTGVNLDVDSTRLTGGLAYVARERPGIGLRVNVDRLNLDAYLPPSAAAASAGALPPWPKLADWLKSFDANLDLHAGALNLAGVPAEGVAIDATLTGGALTIRHAEVTNLAGINASITGGIAGLAPLSGADLAFRVQAASLAQVARAAALPPSLLPEGIGRVSATGSVWGDPVRATVQLSLGAAGGTVELGGTIADLETTPNYDLKARAIYPELGHVVQVFAPAYRPRGGTLGPLDLYAEVAGSTSALSLTAIKGMVGPVTVAGETSIDLAGVRPKLTADLQTTAIEVERFLPTQAQAGPAIPVLIQPAFAGTAEPWSTDAYDLAWMRAADVKLGLTAAGLAWHGFKIEAAALRARLDDGALTLEQLDGRIEGGQIGLKGRLAAPATGVPAAALSLTLVRTRLGGPAVPGAAVNVTSGVLDLDLDLKSQGRSDAEMIAGLAGQAKLDMRNGTLVGFDLARTGSRLSALKTRQELAEATSHAMDGGSTSFYKLAGTTSVEGGVVTTKDLSLTSTDGEVAFTGTADLRDWQLALSAAVRPAELAAAPAFTLKLDGPIAQPRRSYDLAALGDYVSARLSAPRTAAAPAEPLPASSAKPTDGPPTGASPDTATPPPEAGSQSPAPQSPSPAATSPAPAIAAIPPSPGGTPAASPSPAAVPTAQPPVNEGATPAPPAAAPSSAAERAPAPAAPMAAPPSVPDQAPATTEAAAPETVVGETPPLAVPVVPVPRAKPAPPPPRAAPPPSETDVFIRGILQNLRH